METAHRDCTALLDAQTLSMPRTELRLIVLPPIHPRRSLEPLDSAHDGAASAPRAAGHLGLAAPPKIAPRLTAAQAVEAASASGAGGGRKRGARERGVQPAACTRPCVYVYELPARMNVLALKVSDEPPISAPGRPLLSL